MREPTQVFTLLETLYGAFDELAKELGVFKVETVRFIKKWKSDASCRLQGLPESHCIVILDFFFYRL